MPSRTALVLAAAVLSCASPRPVRTDAPLPAGPPDPRPLELVESAPVETRLDTELRDAWRVWPELIAGAKSSLDFAHFYASNEPGTRLETVVQAVETAIGRGVQVRFLADASFVRTYPETLDRLERAGAAVRRWDLKAAGGSVLHAKYFVVDREQVMFGSQNFDWRALEHIQELGVRVRDPAIAAAFVALFDADWDVAGGALDRRAGLSAERFPVDVGGVRLTPVFSPRVLLASEALWDLPRLVALIDGAHSTVRVQLLTYRVRDREGGNWTVLDDALRRAAARGVRVELLLADWSKRRGSIDALQDLARAPGIEVRLLTVPRWSGGFIPYARVIHSKYLVADGERGWVGTSNWERDYFFKSRNVGVIGEGRAFAAQLEAFFARGWSSGLTERVDPDATYEPPKISSLQR